MIDGDLRNIFKAHLPSFQWSPIETGMTISGVPDSEYCSNGYQGWIEYKATETDKIKQTTKTKFQIAWHERRARENGVSFVAVRKWHDGGPRKGNPVDEIWIFDGKDIRGLYTQGMRAVPFIVNFGGGPSLWDWKTIRAVLA